MLVVNHALLLQDLRTERAVIGSRSAAYEVYAIRFPSGDQIGVIAPSPRVKAERPPRPSRIQTSEANRSRSWMQTAT